MSPAWKNWRVWALPALAFFAGLSVPPGRVARPAAVIVSARAAGPAGRQQSVRQRVRELCARPDSWRAEEDERKHAFFRKLDAAALSALARELAAEDPPKQPKPNEGFQKTILLEEVVAYWSALDPAAALAFALELAWPGPCVEAALAAADLGRAEEITRVLAPPGGPPCPRVRWQQWFDRLRFASPARAAALEAHPPQPSLAPGQATRDDPDLRRNGKTASEVVQNSTSQWARRDPAAASAWAETQGADERRAAAFGWLRTDPDAAWAWAAAGPRRLPQNWEGQFIGLAAALHPAEAAAWIARLPLTKGQVGACADTWAFRDLDAAEAWAEGIEAAPLREAALVKTIFWLESRDRNAAAAAACMRMPAGNTRLNVLINVLPRWLQQDKPAAEEWVKTAPLTPEERKGSGLERGG